jgi:iron complex outermembrane receptor protein
MTARRRSHRPRVTELIVWFRRTAIAGVLCACAAPASAQQAPPDLGNVSLEDLMNIRVTSASRKEQRVADVAAAVFVITQDDIRRSGLTSVPELLRLAPGVQVARIDASKWAIAIRGSNHRWSNKLLVLVDGRSIYTRQFSGVIWDSVGVTIENIDRIEVVRGPGGAVWGANAVDGVINIITLRASQTPGLFARTDAGLGGDASAAVRYGGSRGATAYRWSIDLSRHAATNLTADTRGDDDWASAIGGVRVDWTGRPGHTLTFQSDVMRGEANFLYAFPTGVSAPAGGWPTLLQPTTATLGSALGRWTRVAGSGGSLEVQAYVQADERHEAFQARRSQTWDVGADYHGRYGRHDLVAGTGYRSNIEHIHGTFAFTMTPDHLDLRTFNVFAQDEIALAGDRVFATIGAKGEYETLGGWSLQPTGRLRWVIAPGQQAWAATSQAVRTPSLINQTMRVNLTSFPSEIGLPAVVSIFGSTDFRNETATSVEAGYRFDRDRFAFDVAAFWTRYEDLISVEPLEPAVEMTYGEPSLLLGSRLDNLMNARARGVEVTGRWMPRVWVRVEGHYTFYRATGQPDLATRDPSAGQFDGSAPARQWLLRPSMSFGRFDVDLTVSHVGALRLLTIPAYTRTDARVEFAATPSWSLSLSGQNLFGAAHREFDGFGTVTASMLMPRQINARMAWRF